MSVEGNKALARRFFEEGFNQGNLDVVDELIAEDAVDHEKFPGTSDGPVREQVKQIITIFRDGFPDLHVSVEDLIGEGDMLVARLMIHGTHDGEFMGIPATGKQASFAVIDVVRIANGQMAEHWGVSDTAGMLQQLGVMPSPEEAPA